MAHRVSPCARADLDEIWRYIAEESGDPDIARRAVAALTDRFYILSEHPRMGRIRHDLGPGLRSHPVRNHLIFYRLAGNDIVIVRVLHGRRDIQSLFARS
jgi:toxin ParE1/3/4